MPPLRTAERLRRILVLVPWVMRHPGVTVGRVCERFSMTPEELAADLDVLLVCGLPPFGPGDLIEAWIDGDEVVIHTADFLARPPRLTRSEALALLVMGRAVAQLPGLGEAASLAGALDKLERAIAPGAARDAREAAGHISVDLQTAGAQMLAELREAIAERRGLRIVYYTHGRDEIGEREVDPLLVYHLGGNWYLAAFDHRSGEERIFRADRIKEAARTERRFDPPAGFDPARYRDGPLFTPSPRDEEVTIDLSPAAAWIREVTPHDREQDLGDGRVRIELRTPHLAWLVRTILAAGTAAIPVAPPALRDAVQEAARRALASYRR